MQGHKPQLWLSWAAVIFSLLFWSVSSRTNNWVPVAHCWCAHFSSYHPYQHTHSPPPLALINTHINHPKYRCDKPIINLHCQVQYSDNEFSGNAVDSIRSLTADGCCNDFSMSPGYSTAIDEAETLGAHTHRLTHMYTQRYAQYSTHVHVFA